MTFKLLNLSTSGLKNGNTLMLCKPFHIKKPRAAQSKWIQAQTVTSPRNTLYLSEKELCAPNLKSPWPFVH